jgi:hypothetical protein
MSATGQVPHTLADVLPVALCLVVALLAAGGLLLRRHSHRSTQSRSSTQVSVETPASAASPPAEPPELGSVLGFARIFDRSRRLLVAEELPWQELRRGWAPDWMLEHARRGGAQTFPRESIVTSA